MVLRLAWARSQLSVPSCCTGFGFGIDEREPTREAAMAAFAKSWRQET
jgi:hypothetical protein